MSGWFYLVIGVGITLFAGPMIKMSQGFTVKPWLGATGILLMIGASIMWGLALKTLPLATAYIVWTGIGVLGVALIGLFLFGETFTPLKLAFMVMIFVGCVGLKLITKV